MEVKDGGEAKEIRRPRIPETADNGLILLKVQLATINVQIQSLIIELEKQKSERKKDIEFLITWLDNLILGAQNIINELPRKTRNQKNFKRLIESYNLGIKTVKGKLEEMK